MCQAGQPEPFPGINIPEAVLGTECLCPPTSNSDDEI